MFKKKCLFDINLIGGGGKIFQLFHQKSECTTFMMTGNRLSNHAYILVKWLPACVLGATCLTQ